MKKSVELGKITFEKEEHDREEAWRSLELHLENAWAYYQLTKSQGEKVEE